MHITYLELQPSLAYKLTKSPKARINDEHFMDYNIGTFTLRMRDPQQRPW